jgi:SSS family solute:Na+ symporter
LGWLELHFTLIAGLIFAVSGLLFLLAGWLMSPPSPEQIARFIFRQEIMEKTVPGPLWQDYRIYAAILMLLTLWLVAAFW